MIQRNFAAAPPLFPMFNKLKNMPLKWKVLLGTQATATVVLIARRMDPTIFDSLFEKRVLVITQENDGSFQVSDNKNTTE